MPSERDSPNSRQEASLAELLEQMGEAGAFVRRDGKFFPPPIRRALVPRPDLLRSLSGPDAQLALVTAPAGYGKSTLLAQRAAVECRPVAWVTLEEADNDPVVLLTNLTIAIGSVEPVDSSLVSSLWRAGSKPTAMIASRFGRVLANRSVPFVLVLDDLHNLVEPEALDVLAVVVVDLPVESALILAARTMPPLPFARLRAASGLMRLDARDLAFTEREARALFTSQGLEVGEPELAELLRLTEGWPAALYLASQSLQPGLSGSWGGTALAPDDRLIAEYLKDELLGRLPALLVSFLLDASCLERLSGELCDAILERDDSAELLQQLVHDNWLVIALDDRDACYRLHHLLAELLQAELAAQDPERLRRVHARASSFFGDQQDIDAAIHHAVRAGDVDRAEMLVIVNFSRFASHGRHATIKQWLGQFSATDLATRPWLSIIAGYSRLAAGDGPGAAHWRARAAQLLAGQPIGEGVGWTPPVALAILRATLAFGPAQDMAEYAAQALGAVDSEDWQAMCSLLLGAAEFMLGHDERAARLLEEGLGYSAEYPNLLALCLAHLAVMGIERGDWEGATASARRGRDVMTEHGLEEVANLFMVSAVSSLVEARAGRVAEARADHHRSLRGMTGFIHQAAWANLQARVSLAHASLLLGDRVSARTLLDEAEHVLQRVGDAPRVTEQLTRVRGLLGEVDDRGGEGPSSLTSAERRVLEYLPTHLTLADIADRLYVSRNTVKTQAIAIYRKLDVSSRGAAVDVAQSVGLLEDHISTS